MVTPAAQKQMKNNFHLWLRRRLKTLIKENNISDAAIKKLWLKKEG